MTTINIKVQLQEKFGAGEACSSSQEKILSKSPELDTRRPIWNIGHMVNDIEQVNEFLNSGGNALELDVMFDSKGNPTKTYHGMPCDCFRDCTHSEDFSTYVKHLRKLTNPGEQKFKENLVLVIMDLKVKSAKNAQNAAGQLLVKLLLEHYWTQGGRAYIVFSLPDTSYVSIFKSILKALEEQGGGEYSQKIGFNVLANEDLRVIKDAYRSVGITERIWLSDGITNCLYRGTDRLVKAIKARDSENFISKVDWWTVNFQWSMRRVLRLGVDAIITNRPDNLDSVLKEKEFRHLRLATIDDSPWGK